MEGFLQKDFDDTGTPESIAWRLLMNEEDKEYGGQIQFVFVDHNDNIDEMSFYDSLASQFETLIIIYMEMVFSMLKINHISALVDGDGEIDESIDFEKSFKPDISNFTITDLKDVFREKFKKMRIFLSVIEIYDGTKEQPFGQSSDYYCRIILRDTPEGKTYFRKNRSWLDPNKRYTFVIRNDTTRSHKSIEDFYAVCMLANMKVKIAFSSIRVHVKPVVTVEEALQYREEF